MAEESYNFDRLTREMVASQLAGDPHAPARAAEIARQTIVAGIKGAKAAGASQEARESIRQICHGTLQGLQIIDKELPQAAVALLQNLAEAAQELSLDPSDMMTWALEGMARIARTAPPAAMQRVQEAIDAKFMGAGQLFSELCDKARTSA